MSANEREECPYYDEYFEELEDAKGEDDEF